MTNKQPSGKIIGILIVGLIVGMILIIPVNMTEPFESAYQVPVQKEYPVPVQKEYQVPIQREKSEVVISQTFPLWKEEVSPSLYNYQRWIVWRPRYQNEWITGFFTANDSIMYFIIMDSKNFNNFTNDGMFDPIHFSYYIKSDYFTFKPQTIDDYYFYFQDPFGEEKIISIELTSHWYETEYETHYRTEYETRYKTEYETHYKTEYRIVKKPLYNIFLP